ncbi:MAG: AraC family transcriptional regulator [Roseobacter sp.]
MELHADLLQSHPVLRTRDLDEARAAVADRYCDHRLDVLGADRLEVQHNHARGTHLSLNLLGYGADVAIDPGELTDFYLLQIPLCGQARILHRGEVVDANPDFGTLLNPDRPTQMIWRGDCRKLMVQIDADFLAQVATQEIAMELPGPIRFDPKVDLHGTAGQRLKALAVAVARAVDDGSLRLSHRDLSLHATEHALARAMLQAQPSNVSHLLNATQKPGSAYHLRRATAYINAHFHETIGLDEIASAAGVHRRTLQSVFRSELGLSPLEYVKNTRLDHACYHLSKRHNRASVTEIAFDCGYSHLGRFSRDFRLRFGCAPRDV